MNTERRSRTKRSKKLVVNKETLRVSTGVKAGLCTGGDYSTTPDHSIMDPEFP